MPDHRPLRIDVAGGGPAGLAFALALRAYGADAHIRVFEPRWHDDGTRLRWRGPAHGNPRRQQVVTLQSRVWQALPGPIRRALFGRGDHTTVWPTSADSPPDCGPPRNLPIQVIEDRLLDALCEAPGVALLPQRYDPAAAERADVLAVCDGARSPTREHFIEPFGRPHPGLYLLHGQPLEETLLGLEVDTPATPGEAVLLTIAQNRYLLNLHRGRGFLNLRLSHDEAARLPAPGHGASDALGDAALRASALWPAIADGLTLFGVDPRHPVQARVFRYTPVHRPRFVAETAPGQWACLLGDAAIALHPWPGRGLNTGLKAALSLARGLAGHGRDGRLRAADLVAHEGLMQMLQARELGNRSWQTMLMRDADGVPRPIDERIRRGSHGPCDRAALTAALMARLRQARARLVHRSSALPGDAWLAGRLARLHERTLKVLVESGAWVTAEVGGPEVDVPPWPPLAPGARRPACPASHWPAAACLHAHAPPRGAPARYIPG